MQALKYKVVLRKQFVQALWYKVVMVVVCASFVLQSSTGKCFVQTLKCRGV